LRCNEDKRQDFRRKSVNGCSCIRCGVRTLSDGCMSRWPVTGRFLSGFASESTRWRRESGDSVISANIGCIEARGRQEVHGFPGQTACISIDSQLPATRNIADILSFRVSQQIRTPVGVVRNVFYTVSGVLTGDQRCARPQRCLNSRQTYRYIQVALLAYSELRN
jgi:hypothetical protein